MTTRVAGVAVAIALTVGCAQDTTSITPCDDCDDNVVQSDLNGAVSHDADDEVDKEKEECSPFDRTGVHEYCDMQCDCDGCVPGERTACYTDIEHFVDVAESGGCVDLLSPLAECLDATSSCGPHFGCVAEYSAVRSCSSLSPAPCTDAIGCQP